MELYIGLGYVYVTEEFEKNDLAMKSTEERTCSLVQLQGPMYVYHTVDT